MLRDCFHFSIIKYLVIEIKLELIVPCCWWYLLNLQPCYLNKICCKAKKNSRVQVKSRDKYRVCRSVFKKIEMCSHFP